MSVPNEIEAAMELFDLPCPRIHCEEGDCKYCAAGNILAEAWRAEKSKADAVVVDWLRERNRGDMAESALVVQSELLEKAREVLETTETSWQEFGATTCEGHARCVEVAREVLVLFPAKPQEKP